MAVIDIPISRDMAELLVDLLEDNYESDEYPVHAGQGADLARFLREKFGMKPQPGFYATGIEMVEPEKSNKEYQMEPCKNEMSAMETRFAIVRELLNNGRFNDEDDLLKKADKVTRWILGQDQEYCQDEPSKYPESESAGKESLSHFHPTGYIFGDPLFYRGGKGGEVFWVDVDGELKKHKNWTVTGIENVKLNWKLASQDKEGDYRSRMDEEHAQLEERIGRLSEFICSDEYEDLPKEEKGDLAQQYKTMRKYAEVLYRRILRAQEVQ